MEAFLKDEGFRVLNLGRIQRAREVNLQSTAIYGLDNDRRIVVILGFLIPFAGKDVLYTVSLTSPPPTQRSPQLEEAILTLVSEKLGCVARQVVRSENGPDATEFYNREVTRIDGLFREGAALEKPQ
jgi:hypothetical protein